MNIRKMLKPRSRNSVLRNQALIYIAIIATGIFVISLIYNTATLRYYRTQTTELAGSVLRQTGAALEDKTEQYRHMMELMYLNHNLQLLFFNEYYYEVPRSMARKEIISYLAPTDSSLNDLFTPVTNITFYTTNKTLGEEPGSIVYLENARNEPWLAVAEEQKKDRLLWFVTLGDNNEKKLSAIHTMRNLRVSTSPGDFLGYMKMDFNIDQFFRNILLGKESSDEWLLITDATNHAVASTLGVDLQKEAAKLTIGRKDSEWNTVRLGNQNYMVSGVEVKGTDWKCWYAVSEAALTTGFRQVNLPILLLTLAMTAAMAIAAWFAASRLARRISNLASAMGSLEQGRFDVRVEDRGHDEVAFLASGFNDMATKLDEHVTHEYRDRIQLREYDMQALQAQLHPHFLYNSLASISWLGMQSGATEIPAISNALARFYRLSLSRGKNIIMVHEEIDQIQAYLEIMSIRYRNKITAVYKMDDKLCDTWTLKLILQPFVENSLLHGLHALKNHINIIVSVEAEDNALVWKVIDDGVGMPREMIPDMEGGEASAGYGIANVHRRIRMYFGEEYGVKIMSEEGIGTAVMIRTPMMETRMEEE